MDELVPSRLLENTLDGAMSRILGMHAGLVADILREGTRAGSTQPGVDGKPRVPANQLLFPESGSIGRFAIVPDQAVLGEGGSGVVLRARDKDLGREVAVKLSRAAGEADSDIEADFFQEARVTAGLDHPGIVPIHEFGRTEDGRPWIAMRRVTGESLALRLARHSAFDPGSIQTLIACFEKVCETVAYAHAGNIIHCDLKPANILLGACGEVYVVDWGLARHTNSEIKRGAHRDGRVEGTLAWMAPEQARGDDARIGATADVFALGAILAEILTGVRPREMETGRELVLSARAGWMDALTKSLGRCTEPRELADIALSCLQPDPAARPQNAGELAKAIAGWRTRMALELHESRRVIEATEQRARAERRLRFRTMFLLLALIGLGALALGISRVHERALEREANSSREQVDAALIKAALCEALARSEPGKAEAHLLEAAGILDHVAAAPLPEIDSEVRARLESTRTALANKRAAAVRARVLSNMLQKLNALRGPTPASAAVDARYSAIFADLGLGSGSGNDWASSDAVADVTMREEIIEALDTWASLKQKLQKPQDAVRILRLANGLDSDEDRKELRQILNRGEIPRLLTRADAAVAKPQVAGALWLAEALDDLGEHDVSMGLYRKVLACAPVDFRANREYAVRLHAIGGPVEEVLKHLTLALAARPDVLATRHEISRILLMSGRIAEGESWIASLLVDAPSYGPAWILAAELAMMRQQYDLALTHVDHVLAGQPDDVAARCTRALILRSRGDERAALDAFAEACRRAPGEDVAQLLYAGALQEAGRDEEAIVWFERCMYAYIDNAQVQFGLGLSCFRCGRDADAVRAFDAAVTLNPGDAETHCNRALALENLGRLAEAAVSISRGHALGIARGRPWTYPSAQWKQRIDDEAALVGTAGSVARGGAGAERQTAGARLLRARARALGGHHDAAFRDFATLVDDEGSGPVLNDGNAHLAARAALASVLLNPVPTESAATETTTDRIVVGLEWLERAMDDCAPPESVQRDSARTLQTAALRLVHDPVLAELRALDWNTRAPKHQTRWEACWRRLDENRTTLRLALKP